MGGPKFWWPIKWSWMVLEMKISTRIVCSPSAFARLLLERAGLRICNFVCLRYLLQRGARYSLVSGWNDDAVVEVFLPLRGQRILNGWILRGRALEKKRAKRTHFVLNVPRRMCLVFAD